MARTCSRDVQMKRDALRRARASMPPVVPKGGAQWKKRREILLKRYFLDRRVTGTSNPVYYRERKMRQKHPLIPHAIVASMCAIIDGVVETVDFPGDFIEVPPKNRYQFTKLKRVQYFSVAKIGQETYSDMK